MMKNRVMGNWISVKEKMPEIAQIVLFALKHPVKVDVYAGFRANGGWYAYRIGEDSKQYIPNGIENVTITHWMPLPEPPKSEPPTEKEYQP